MPTTLRTPRFLKGALVALDVAAGGPPRTVVFQYNPETLNRSFQPQSQGGDAGQSSKAIRFAGPPVETIALEVMLDATDALEAGDGRALETGIGPQLAAFETLMAPSCQQVGERDRLLAQGMIEIPPFVTPLTLFVWGKNRVLPVSLVAYSCREELFDAGLNPIRAVVSLNLRALTYADLDPAHKGYHLFLAYQQAKETMARHGVNGSPDGAIGVNVGQF